MAHWSTTFRLFLPAECQNATCAECPVTRGNRFAPDCSYHRGQSERKLEMNWLITIVSEHHGVPKKIPGDFNAVGDIFTLAICD
jgi:hypothetical protein